MEKTIKKAIKTGYGLGLLTLDQGKKLAAKVQKELDLNKKESLMLAKALVKTSEKAAKDVMGVAQKHFKSALKKASSTPKRKAAPKKKASKKGKRKKK